MKKMSGKWVMVAGVAALSGMLGLASSSVSAAQKLYLYNWTDYISPRVIKQFEQQYDAQVVQNYYTSNAEMFSRLRSGGDAMYDVIVPTDYYVPRLKGAGLIQPLGGIKGRDQVSSDFIDAPYDKGAQYSVPYLWGATGIVYNRKALPDAPGTWQLLFDPDKNRQKPFSLLGGDAQVLFGAACASLGKGFDCVGKEAWLASGKLIASTLKRPNFQGFTDSTAAIDQVIRGVASAAVTYSGDFDYRRSEDPKVFKDLAFVIPAEGSQRGVDTLAIPAHAPHPTLAREFISFMQKPEIAALNAEYSHYYTPNKGAERLLTQHGKQVVPSTETRERLHFVPLLTSAQLTMLNQLWNEIRSN